jgi:hypothetical protein
MIKSIVSAVWGVRFYWLMALLVTSVALMIKKDDLCRSVYGSKKDDTLDSTRDTTVADNLKTCKVTVQQFAVYAFAVFVVCILMLKSSTRLLTTSRDIDKAPGSSKVHVSGVNSGSINVGGDTYHVHQQPVRRRYPADLIKKCAEDESE